MLAVPRGQIGRFHDLLDAYGETDIRVRLLPYTDAMPGWAELAAQCEDTDAVLLAGSARFAPRTTLPGPFLTMDDGRRVPAGWVPLRNPQTTDRFVKAAARVHRRSRERKTVALLGQWHPRYLHLADRIETLLEGRARTFRWTGEVIMRDDVVGALGSGLGLGIYVGHGRSVGWVGYAGMRARHFSAFRGEPLGGLVSLCCHTASRRRTSLSYSEALPLEGVTAAAFGAVGATLHTDNTRWAVRLCEVVRSGVDTIGDLIVRSAPPNPRASAQYRIVGDPLAPLAAGRGGEKRARAIPTYP